MALNRLRNELKEISKDTYYYYSVSPQKDNFFKWDGIIIGPQDTIFEGANIKVALEFPQEYPNKPPLFHFVTPLFHPNVYKDGKVCISILHEGVDEFEYESLSERWNPSQSVNSILVSIHSMLSSPNLDSPANIDASKMWRENFSEYKKIIYKMVANSQ